MTLDTLTERETQQISVRIVFRESAWSGAIPLGELQDNLELLREFVFYCGLGDVEPEARFLVAQMPPDAFHMDIAAESISFNSPLDIVLLIGASSSVLTGTALALTKIGRQIERWRIEHAEATTTVLQQSVIQVALLSLHDDLKPLTEVSRTTVDGDVAIGSSNQTLSESARLANLVGRLELIEVRDERES